MNKTWYFSFDKALTDNFINQIEEDVDNAGLSLNNSSIGGVYFSHGSQFFLSHMLQVCSASATQQCLGRLAAIPKPHDLDSLSTQA